MVSSIHSIIILTAEEWVAIFELNKGVKQFFVNNGVIIYVRKSLEIEESKEDISGNIKTMITKMIQKITNRFQDIVNNMYSLVRY